MAGRVRLHKFTVAKRQGGRQSQARGDALYTLLDTNHSACRTDHTNLSRRIDLREDVARHHHIYPSLKVESKIRSGESAWSDFRSHRGPERPHRLSHKSLPFSAQRRG